MSRRQHAGTGETLMAQPRGKKIDVIRIEEGAQGHNVELRWDRNNGDFFARLGDVEFTAKTLVEIKKKLQDKAKEMVAYEFKWYLRVRYSIQQTWSLNHSSDIEIGDDQWKDARVGGIDFAFDVVERSQAIETDVEDYRNNRVWMRMGRAVEEVDGKLTPTGNPTTERFTLDEDGNDDFIPFTEERYAKLCALRDGLKLLAEKLYEVVGEGAKKTAKRLDALKAPLLMLPAKGGA
jgi:hypothetical protein